MADKNLKPTFQDLQAKQQELIDKLKNDHPEVYKWFVDRRIDLTNLGKYAGNLTAALALVTASYQPPTNIAPQPTPTPEVRVIDKSEFKGLTREQRAQLVWDRYGTLIHNAAAAYNLDPNLIFATIMLESGGDTYAIRHEPRINDASYGLGQILYGTARGIGYRGTPDGLFDPETNIDLIAKYHRRNQDAYEGDLSAEQLTIAYNTGSPYKRPWPGHLKKFYKWYNRAANLEVDLS